MASKRPHRPTPTVTLEPRTTTPSETWWYTLPGGSRGVIVGDVTWAATYILFHAFKRRWRCVSLRFPKARCGGLLAQTVTLSSPADLHRLRAVDVEAVVHRHGLGCRMPGRTHGWRWALRGWPRLGESLPVMWPAVP